MSDDNQTKPEARNDPEEPTQDVNLKLIYSLIALALIGAIAVAFLIVRPFYHHQ